MSIADVQRLLGMIGALAARVEALEARLATLEAWRALCEADDEGSALPMPERGPGGRFLPSKPS